MFRFVALFAGLVGCAQEATDTAEFAGEKDVGSGSSAAPPAGSGSASGTPVSCTVGGPLGTVTWVQDPADCVAVGGVIGEATFGDDDLDLAWSDYIDGVDSAFAGSGSGSGTDESAGSGVSVIAAVAGEVHVIGPPPPGFADAARGAGLDTDHIPYESVKHNCKRYAKELDEYMESHGYPTTYTMYSIHKPYWFFGWRCPKKVTEGHALNDYHYTSGGKTIDGFWEPQRSEETDLDYDGDGVIETMEMDKGHTVCIRIGSAGSWEEILQGLGLPNDPKLLDGRP
jgi:hypothetical protein